MGRNEGEVTEYKDPSSWLSSYSSQVVLYLIPNIPASLLCFISCYQHPLPSLRTPFIKPASSSAVRANLEQESYCWPVSKARMKRRAERGSILCWSEIQAPDSTKIFLPKTPSCKWTEWSGRNKVSRKQYKWRRKDAVGQERGLGMQGSQGSLGNRASRGNTEEPWQGPVWLVWKRVEKLAEIQSSQSCERAASITYFDD